MLGVASVAGRRVRAELLATVAGVPEAELERALREALASQIVVTDRSMGIDAYSSATPCSPRRSTTTSCHRNGAGFTRRTRPRSKHGQSRRVPRAPACCRRWPTMRPRPTSRPAPCAPGWRRRAAPRRPPRVLPSRCMPTSGRSTCGMPSRRTIARTGSTRRPSTTRPALAAMLTGRPDRAADFARVAVGLIDPKRDRIDGRPPTNGWLARRGSSAPWTRAWRSSNERRPRWRPRSRRRSAPVPWPRSPARTCSVATIREAIAVANAAIVLARLAGAPTGGGARPEHARRPARSSPVARTRACGPVRGL